MKPLITLSLLLLSVALWAQPLNDNCEGLIDLGVAPACPTTFFSNVNTTASDIGFGNIPFCFNGGTVQNDVWFAFTTSDTIFDYSITVTGITDGVVPAMVNPQIAIYRGDCEVDGLAELLCASAPNGQSVIVLDALGLTPNVTYYIRINDYSATATPNWGTFQLCVSELIPPTTIDEGGSTFCSGVLYDSGGPDGNYGNDENHVFSICPTQPNSCITFTLDYYNIESGGFFGGGDQILFFDGPNTSGMPLAALNGANQSDGGAVCYQVQASSGCLTVQFISDGTTSFEGFAGSWECSTQACVPNVPITVEGGVTEQQIIDFVSTPQTLVTIADINCPAAAYGIFNAPDNTDLGLSRGLLLTTGTINWAPGPNNDGGGGNFDANNFADGDPDLDYLSQILGDNDLSNDACIVELDVEVFTNELSFEYIFGSEEYPEFVNQFNDIFAFFISGPGIVGDPNIGNQLNIAVLPDGAGTPVQINSVNNELNWQYYRNNLDGQSIQYDGLTSDFLGVKKSLTARAQVIPCNTYRLKLAIADRGDFVFDSGVFISEIRSGTPNLFVNFASGINYLLEDCTNTPDEIVLQLNNVVDEVVSYNVVIGGTATLGVDYELNIPSTIVFQPGQTEVRFPITPLSDLLTEGIETIEISLTNDFGCGEVTYTTLVIELHDELVVEIFSGQDTAFVCQNSSIQLEVSGATDYFWTPPGVLNNPLSATPIATPSNSLTLTVVGNVGPCFDTTSIFLQIIDPMISIATNDITDICEGTSVGMIVTNNVNSAGFSWSPQAGLNDPTSLFPIATPLVTTSYVASVEIAGCTASDTLTINVDAHQIPTLVPDTLICQNYSVRLAALADMAPTTTFAWFPPVGLDDPTSPTPLATPETTTTYTVVATSASGFCSDTLSTTITVVPANVAISNPDTVEICLGTVLPLNALNSTNDPSAVLWSPNDGSLDTTIGFQVFATPQLSTTYFVEFNVGECSVFDSVYVRVDSLPTLGLSVTPFKEVYCQGEILTLFSTTFEPADFPDIVHQWLPGIGYETGDSLFNMVITTQDTFVYQRLTTNRACSQVSEITINVITPESLSISPVGPIICAGDSQLLTATYMGTGDVTWTPATNITCTDCLTPTVTPSTTTSYTVEAENEGCPVQQSVVVTVFQLPSITVIANTETCATAAATFNLATFAPQPGVLYLWSSPTDPSVNANAPQLTVTPTQTNTYVLRATNICGTVEQQVTITVVQEPTLTVSDILVCAGDDATLTAVTNAPAGVSQDFSWTVNGQAYQGQTISISGLTAPTTATLSYSYGPNCGVITETVDINVVQVEFSLGIEANVEDNTAFEGQEITVAAIIEPADLGPELSYIWQINNQVQGGQTQQTLLHIPTVAGNYVYGVTATDDNGCEEIALLNIEVNEPNARIPNVFTPNGDGTNDVFRVYHDAPIVIETFQVFSRWGQVVFDSQVNEGWDGRYKDTPAPSDVYLYRISYRLGGTTGPLIATSGDVTLLR